MRYERIKFVNQKGISLDGILEFPVSGKPASYAIFAHCFTCGKNLNVATLISHQLAQANIAVLRFDFTGLGESEGEFVNSTFSSNLEDLVSAADFLSKEYEAPEIIIGHSLGGFASIGVLDKITSLKAIATIAAPSNAEHISHLFADKTTDINKEGIAEVSIGGRPFPVTHKFIQDLRKNRPLEILKTSQKALLILHSPQDEIVGINHASVLYENASHPKSFISLDASDHLLSKDEDAIYAGSVIATWLRRYLDLERKISLSTERQAAVRTGTEKYYTEILTGNHFLIADEPKASPGVRILDHRPMICLYQHWAPVQA